jgi:hypothetical protein
MNTTDSRGKAKNYSSGYSDKINSGLFEFEKLKKRLFAHALQARASKGLKLKGWIYHNYIDTTYRIVEYIFFLPENQIAQSNISQ